MRWIAVLAAYSATALMTAYLFPASLQNRFNYTHLSRNQNIVKSFLTLFSYTCRLSYFITSSVHCIFAMPLRAYIVRIMQLQAILRSRRRDEPRPAVEAGSWLQRSPRPPQRMPCECHGIALPPACSHISTG